LISTRSAVELFEALNSPDFAIVFVCANMLLGAAKALRDFPMAALERVNTVNLSGAVWTTT